MEDQIRDFILAALREMNYDVSDVTEDTDLGPKGLDVESLGLADLAIRAEDAFKVKFSSDEMEMMALMTIGEFSTEVAARIAKSTAGTSA